MARGVVRGLTIRSSFAGRARSCLAWLLAAGLALGCAEGAEPARQQGPERRSLYVTVRDGTRIAVDVHLPEGFRDGTQLPAVMRITRYWRAIELTSGAAMPDDDADAVLAGGFAYVTMDVRGSGASFGVSTAPWSREEVLDYRDVLDWIVEQPWSSGRVGALGDSYEGNTAALLSALEHPAVRAVVPRFFDFDAYRSPALPGGLFHEDFVRSWSELTGALDSADVCAVAVPRLELACDQVLRLIRGPLAVDEDTDRELLASAIAEHQSNTEVYGAASALTYRDDAYGENGPSLSELSPQAYAPAINRGGVPWLLWASWYDAGTADGALSAFTTLENPLSVVIGAWSHGGQHDADPYREPDAPNELGRVEQLGQALTFLGRYLRGDAEPPERSIRYYTVGEGQWRTTATWPPPGTQVEEWYLTADARLDTEPPTAGGSDRYEVDFTAATGSANRWATQKDGADVVYPDRADESAKVLSYTSDPLPAAARIVGHPTLTLHLSSTREDGALFVYLEDVAPDGKITYLTEGQLRLLHRGGTAPLVGIGVQQSFLRADGAPLVPSETQVVELTLLPVSASMRAGHRLRVSIAGHDAASFRRYPEEGPVELTVEYSPDRPSMLSLSYLPE